VTRPGVVDVDVRVVREPVRPAEPAEPAGPKPEVLPDVAQAAGVRRPAPPGKEPLRLTAAHLAALHAAGDLTEVWWPGTDDEPRLRAMTEALAMIRAANR
jgi:hypothetical protein